MRFWEPEGLMTRKEKPYRHLPGRANRGFGLFQQERQQLWLASDHLLLVIRSHTSESYKRFDLQDIQALVACRTTAGRTANIILAIMAVAFGSLLLMAVLWWKWPPEAGIILGILGGTFAITLGANVLLGPTCLFRLHTAVQVENM